MNWHWIKKWTLIGGAMVIIIILGFYFYFQRKVAKIQEQVTATSTIPGFSSGFTLEDLKKFPVPEPGEKVKEGLAVPLEAVPSGLQVESKIRIFEIKGENGTLSPRDFNVYQNDILNIKLTAVDEDYDFYLEGYNLQVKARKGETKKIEFQATNIGRYLFYCSLCSSKEKPAGQLLVIPR